MRRGARQILDMTSMYLNNCVLGISLFNFGARLCVLLSCGKQAQLVALIAHRCRSRARLRAPRRAGLFAYVHGIISCGYRRAAEVVVLRSIVSPVCCLCVMLIFGLRGDALKIMVMQGALPQAVSSFVVFKEFKIQPEVFSTSTTVGTALCLPVMCIWCVLRPRGSARARDGG
jgi:hypothetical protein